MIARRANIVAGVRSFNSTSREIAEHLGFHYYATMSRAIRRVERV
jgi:hypothetical protein